MKYFLIKDKKDRVVAVVGHDYLTSYYICRSRSEAFTRAFYGVVRKNEVGKLVTKKDHVIINRFDQSYPTWMNSVLKEACSSYWRVGNSGDISNNEVEIDDLVRKHFK